MSSNPNVYFKTLLEFDLHKPHFKTLKNPNCDSCSDIEIRWSELQINNDFNLGDALPIPNTFANASITLEKLSTIQNTSKDDFLLKVLQEISFERNEELVKKLVLLPHLTETKKIILRLLCGMKKTDFSVLADVPKEQIEEEKFKLLMQVIRECK